MSMTDFMVGTLWSSRRGGSGPNGQAAVEHFARHGLTDPEAQDQIRRRAGYYPDLVPAMPARYTRLLHGAPVAIGGRRWRVNVGYGHATDHVPVWKSVVGGRGRKGRGD